MFFHLSAYLVGNSKMKDFSLARNFYIFFKRSCCAILTLICMLQSCFNCVLTLIFFTIDICIIFFIQTSCFILTITIFKLSSLWVAGTCTLGYNVTYKVEVKIRWKLINPD